MEKLYFVIIGIIKTEQDSLPSYESHLVVLVPGRMHRKWVLEGENRILLDVTLCNDTQFTNITLIKSQIQGKHSNVITHCVMMYTPGSSNVLLKARDIRERQK